MNSLLASNAQDLLGNFQYLRVLNQNNRDKRICLLGQISVLYLPENTPNTSNDGSTDLSNESMLPALLEIESINLTPEFIEHAFAPANLDPTATANLIPNEMVHSHPFRDIHLIFHNDIWYGYQGNLTSPSEFISALPILQNENRIFSSISKLPLRFFKFDLTFPASQNDIAKRMPQSICLFSETCEFYIQHTLPFIRNHPVSEKHWIKNILSGISEAESILFDDKDPSAGYVLLPDSKWDRQTAKSLYIQCIYRDNTLSSIRDLRRHHIPVLEQSKKSIERILRERHGLPISSVRLYFHYLPTFYQLHLHVAHVELEQNCSIGRAHLLDDVIQNLQDDPEYYGKRTLQVILGSQHTLYEVFTNN